MKRIWADILALCTVPVSDAELFSKWMLEQHVQTNFDIKTLAYPRTCMARAKDGDETIAMVPLHPFIMMESLAQKSDLTDSELVLALARIDEQLFEMMKMTGLAETFFITNNKRFADTCENHGWIKAMFDPERKEWLMKRRANIDWVALLENKDAH